MMVQATFNNISATNVYRGGQFYQWGKPQYPEKTTVLSEVTDKIDHIMLHSVPLAMGFQGRIQVFKLGGTHLIKLRRAEGSANIFGVFRVKNYDFTPKNHIFSNSRGRRENFWGISCEKSRFYDKKSYFFPILGGARAGCAPPLNPPLGSNSQPLVVIGTD